jgi:hypothetical protein
MIRLILVNFLWINLLPLLQLEAQYDASIRLNDIRILASHNSYKKKPDKRIIKFLSRFKRRLGASLNPIRIDYGHVTLSQQFNEYGIRGIELDLYNDPWGGHFERRRINRFILGLRQHSRDSVMKKPGIKMLHIADVDYESHYRTFSEALAEINAWSQSHPGHIPLFINLELKNASPGDYTRILRMLGFKRAITFDSAAFVEIDQTIRQHFRDSTLFTPQMLRDTFSTTSERLSTMGWPSLNAMLGKVIFILDGNEASYKRFSSQHLAFSYGQAGKPETAFVIRNNPVEHETEISALSDTYIVRTRTDVETMEARTNDYTMFNSAMRSRAQILSTDYYMPDISLSRYSVSLEPYKTQKSRCFILR